MEIILEQALATQGWMAPDELTFLAKFAAKVPLEGTIVEVGSYMGRSACALAANTQATIYCVDLWNDWHPSGAYFVTPDIFRANTAQFPNIIPLQKPSVLAAQEMAEKGMKADLIFIDAAHDEQSVRADIAAWRPLLRDGGAFCGHDYGNADWPDVKLVVDELFPAVAVINTIWIAL